MPHLLPGDLSLRDVAAVQNFQTKKAAITLPARLRSQLNPIPPKIISRCKSAKIVGPGSRIIENDRSINHSSSVVRNSFAVSASPPTEKQMVTSSATENEDQRLTKDDLRNFLASGCKPKDKWRIGTEHEKFGINLETKEPISYNQISYLLESIAERYGWERVMEGENIIGLKLGGQSVSLEPGGQFELSGAPLDTIHQTCAEVNSHLYQVKSIAEEMKVGFLGMGFNPKHKLEEIPIMPKGRYKIMRQYMPKVGTLGLEMMFRTCTVQVNLDFSSEQDMIDKFRVGLALQPIATALFANSPFTEGKPNGYKSYRSHIWEDVDNSRCGDLPFVFEPDFSFAKYVDFALDVPMYFVYRQGTYIDATGCSFRDFMDGRLPVLPGAFPSIVDWENHLTTIFPEVRLKRYLEMRGADGGSWKKLCALPALWVGLLYDEEALSQCLELISDWTDLERAMLRKKVPVLGLQTPFRDGLVRHVAQQVVQISKDGLTRRGVKEAHFLNELEQIAKTGRSHADVMLELYETEWGKTVDPLFENGLY